jgi:hypothetical protein
MKHLLNSLKFLWVLLPFTIQAQIASDTVCLGDTSLIRYFISNPESGVQYDWDLASGGTMVNETSDTLFVKWGTVPGLYKITVSSVNSFGCKGQDADYWILLQQAPTINLKPANALICNGGSVIVRATGASNYTWSPAQGLSSTNADSAIVSPQSTTTYTVTGNSGGCSASKSFTVTTGSKPVAGFTYEQTGNFVLKFTNTSTGGTSYSWNFGPGNTSTEENPTAQFPFDNDYVVSLIAQGECGNDTLTKTIRVIKLGFTELTGTKVQIGPNPVETTTFVKLAMNRPEKVQLQVFNMLGQLLHDEQINGKPELIVPVDFTSFAKGVYYLKLTQGAESFTSKVVK